MMQTRLMLLVPLSLFFLSALEREVAGQVSFKRDIRPILSDNCFYCHGPDPNHREADLRLDTPEGAMAVIKLGKPAESELVRRLLAHDTDERMPPAKSNKQLTPTQIDFIRQWIEQGAAWEAHWSFTPLVAPMPPEVSQSAIVRNPIDAFVQGELAARGWRAAPEADRRTLIRRVTLDLTGLPPTVQEVENFLADQSPNAYELVVARLLQSPAFGERMAWDWLDAARYADTNGYQGDNERTMWPWRDWVVKAFNENLPFDQFTLWQLAGDMLPSATQEQKLATGFCRNHMINGEGGRIAEENRVDYVMDMTETVGTVWLGLTLNCCRCHDHKFDPIKQSEYYKLFAFFNQTPVDGGGGNPQTPPTLSVPSGEQQDRLVDLEQQIQALDAAMKLRREQLLTAQTAWEQDAARGLRESPSLWRVPKVSKATASHQQLTIEPDQSVLASGKKVANDNYEIELQPGAMTVGALRLDALQHPSLTKKGLSRAESGNFVLTAFEVYLQSGTTAERQQLKPTQAIATFEQGEHKIQTTLDADRQTGWGVWEGRVVDRSHSAVFYFKEPFHVDENARLIVVLKHESPHAEHNLGRFRLSVSRSLEAKFEELDDAFEAALSQPASERSQEARELLVKRHQQADSAYQELEGKRKSLDASRKLILDSVPKVMVMAERPEPRETRILERGLYNQPGDKVTAAVPASLPKLAADSAADRLALGQWLTSSEQPLTSRVIVNRIWQQFFGLGLVKTVEDFGSQGEVPRYLDLLDWLSADFRDSGWNIKHLVHGIVTSHTYRQSSQLAGSPLAIEDPENRWLSRGPRFRMPSWMLRDQALAVSGLLVTKMGGPAVNGYQPDGIWEEATFGQKKYQRGSADALYRRSLYTFWRRIAGPTIFFDNASRQVCTVKVVRTNTPLQALFTLNDVTFVEAARALATASIENGGANAETRINFIFQQVLARPVTVKEAKVLSDALARSLQQFSAQAGQADALLAVGDSPSPSGVDRVELASWTALCLAVLNLDETLTKE